MDLVNRFLRYVRIDTQSADEAGVTPSTPGQLFKKFSMLKDGDDPSILGSNL